MVDDDCVIVDDYAIIRGNYDTPESKEMISTRFEQAIDTNIENIVIEPEQLAQVISRWLQIGDHLYTASLVSGLGSLAIRFVWPHQFVAYCSLASASILFSGVYTFSWQWDPCFAYKISASSDYPLSLPLASSSGTESENATSTPDPLRTPSDPSISPPLSYTTTDTGASDSPPNEPASSQCVATIITRRTKSEIYRRSLLHTTVSLLAFTLSFLTLDRSLAA